MASSSRSTVYVDEIARTDATNPAHRVTVRQLGSAGAATVRSGASKAVMALAFLAVLIFGCLVIIAGAAGRQRGAAVDEAIDRFESRPRASPRMSTLPSPGAAQDPSRGRVALTAPAGRRHQ